MFLFVQCVGTPLDRERREHICSECLLQPEWEVPRYRCRGYADQGTSFAVLISFPLSLSVFHFPASSLFLSVFLSLFYLLSFPFLVGSGWLCWASFCSQGDYPSVTLDSSSVIYVGGDFHSFCPENLNLIFIFLIRRSGTLQRGASVAYSEVTSGRSTRLNSLKMDD